MSTYYALLLPQHVRHQINEIRRVLFSKSGDASFRARESCILLGRTEDTTLTKRVTCPTLPLKVQGLAEYAESSLFFAVKRQDLAQIRAELGVDHPYTGIYLGGVYVPYSAEIPPLHNLRLALVETREEGNIILWRTLAEKRLQKGKGI